MVETQADTKKNSQDTLKLFNVSSMSKLSNLSNLDLRDIQSYSHTSTQWNNELEGNEYNGDDQFNV